ncbi:hypothetical protein E8D34_04530 [Nocardioides sp. GY 10113]|uniref:hypothetical protein n=1 Tax=Nocardioides sp. GY 10113 TaxID=2569761 RepID=UPI0010A8056B|nr:hypothetical protein [Nocardioides sp. GY 10113]TIC88217.1 hypothetical protein E8D34_04530 [Nocardioides sp. GY 10113]
MTHLVISRRFHGPPRSGNGGWTAGALADALPAVADDHPVTVRLKLPPPLEVPLSLQPGAGAAPHLVLADEGRTVAEAVLSERELVPVPPVGVLEAADAEERYAGLRAHPFPTCFVCGPQRRPGDGLRIFPGPLSPGAARSRENRTVAATWTPYESTLPIAWAAMDCPGGWSTDLLDRPAVLGTMTAVVHRLPSTRERYVVVGEQRDIDGRKLHTAATLYGPGDEVVATAEHVWITIDPQEFR